MPKAFYQNWLTQNFEHNLSAGSFELQTPRDRNGSFEPQVVKKYQTSIKDELQDKILAMYAQGMGYSAISEHLADIYGVKVSNATISTVTDKIITHVKQWQCRALEPIYPIVWLDAIHYKIREEGHVVSKAVYTVLGVNMDGKKQVLGLYVSEAEGAKFWLQILTDLQNRGVEDVLIEQTLDSGECCPTGELARAALAETLDIKFPAKIQIE